MLYFMLQAQSSSKLYRSSKSLFVYRLTLERLIDKTSVELMCLSSVVVGGKQEPHRL